MKQRLSIGGEIGNNGSGGGDIMALDRKKLALVHILKKELQLTDDEYRIMLKKVAGVGSARDLDEPKFRVLMNYFVRSRYYRPRPGGLTLRQKLFIQGMARDLGWEEDHLNHFIHKYYHKPQVGDLDRKEAIRAIESLKQVLKHQKNKPTNGQNRR